MEWQNIIWSSKYRSAPAPQDSSAIFVSTSNTSDNNLKPLLQASSVSIVAIISVHIGVTPKARITTSLSA